MRTITERTVEFRLLAVACATLLAAGCIENRSAPPLSGPSGVGRLLTVTATPDVVPRDGSSQSVIAVNYWDSGSNVPLTGRRLLLSTTAGSLSPSEVVTDGGGNASLIFTAPGLGEPATSATVTVTPVGDNAFNQMSQSVLISLPGPAVPVAEFTVTPDPVTAGSPAIFDASTSTVGAGATIVEYAWNFDLGVTSSGRVVSQTYAAPGTYAVSLTVTDSFGRTANKTIALEVQ